MKKLPTLSENGIEQLLNIQNINKPENVDMYFKIVDFKLIDEKNNLYMCTLKDKKSTYDKFILKNSIIFVKDSIIHIKKVIITLCNNDKIISCLNYENYGIISFDDAAKNDQNEIEQKEKEKEEIERDKKILDEELNEETKLLFQNVKYEKRKKKYFFKWDKGNLKLINIKTNKEKKSSVKKSPKKNKLNKKQDNNYNILNDIQNIEDYNNDKDRSYYNRTNTDDKTINNITSNTNYNTNNLQKNKIQKKKVNQTKKLNHTQENSKIKWNSREKKTKK